MEWWKATVLGILVYGGISIFLAPISFVFGVFFSLIPVAGIPIALVLNFCATFTESVFSGFIAGQLSNKDKVWAGLLSSLIGATIEGFIRAIMFATLIGIIGVSSMLNFIGAYVQIGYPVDGGLAGLFLLGAAIVVAVIIACCGGYLGAKVAIGLPISRISKEIRKIKALSP